MVRFQLRQGNDLLAMDCIQECDVRKRGILHLTFLFERNTRGEKIYTREEKLKHEINEMEVIVEHHRHSLHIHYTLHPINEVRLC